MNPNAQLVRTAMGVTFLSAFLGIIVEGAPLSHRDVRRAATVLTQQGRSRAIWDTTAQSDRLKKGHVLLGIFVLRRQSKVHVPTVRFVPKEAWHHWPVLHALLGTRFKVSATRSLIQSVSRAAKGVTALEARAAAKLVG